MSDGLFGSFFGPIFGNNQRTDVTTVKTVHEIVQRDDAEITRLRAENEKLREQYNAGVAAWNPVYEIVLNERDTLKAENAKLRAALKEAASWLQDAYFDTASEEYKEAELAAAAALKGTHND